MDAKERNCGCVRNNYNLLVLSIAFSVLFTGFNTLQNYVTSLLPGSLGAQSLAILYGSVSVSLLVCPMVVHRLGERATMVLGSVQFVAYMISLIKVYKVVVYIFSVIIGFGAAILWVAQGSYLTKITSSSRRGFNVGLFWGIFQMCNVVGNLCAYFVIKHLSDAALFTILSIFGALGSAMLLLLKPPALETGQEKLLDAATDEGHHAAGGGSGRRTSASCNNADNDANLAVKTQDEHGNGYGNEKENGNGKEIEDKPMTVYQLLVEMLRWTIKKEVLLLVPAFMLTGLELSFWTGEFPQLLEKEKIGLVLTAVGVSEVIGGAVLGRLADMLGSKAVFSFGGACFFAALYASYYLHIHPGSGWWVMYGGAVGFGLADCSFNTQVYSVLGRLFPKKSVPAFTVFQFAQGLGSVVGFIYAPYYPLHGPDGRLVQIWVQGSVMIIALLGFWLVDDRHPLTLR